MKHKLSQVMFLHANIKKSYTYNSISCCIVATLILLFALPPIEAAEKSLILAKQGESSYVIVIPHKHSKSLKEAATELQRDIKLSTGVNIPLQKDKAKIDGPFISLG